MFNCIFIVYFIFAIFHCLPFQFPSDVWEPLKITPIFLPSTEERVSNGLPKGIKDLLYSAMANIGQTVSVRPLPPLEPNKLGKIMQECLKIGEGRWKWQEMAIRRATNEFDNYDGQSTNFYLVIQFNSPSICYSAQFPDLLAAAAPCLSTPFNRRPMVGKMTICLENSRWAEYRSGPDIFRHEILHALGFGMLVPPPNRFSPNSKLWKWHLPEDGKLVPRIAHYLDFAEKATEYARHHFGCSRLAEIEASDGQKMHLNEYFFGNELMTPLLNVGPNLLTMFSALILEATFIGEQQWYRTNREIVAQQTRAYWWGRGFGCAFLEKSCFELATENIQSPFCTAGELANQWEFGPQYRAKLLCFSNGTHLVGTSRHQCQLLDQLEIRPPKGAIKPISLSSQFPSSSIFGRHHCRLFGSEFDHYYCPMAKNLFADDYEKMLGMADVRLIPC